MDSAKSIWRPISEYDPERDSRYVLVRHKYLSSESGLMTVDNVYFYTESIGLLSVSRWEPINLDDGLWHFLDYNKIDQTDIYEVAYAKSYNKGYLAGIADSNRRIEKAKVDGSLIELPCRINDNVYIVSENVCTYDCPSDHEDKNTCEGCPYEDIVEFIIMSAPFRLDMVDKIGDYIFLTHEEAEKEIERRKLLCQ